MLDGGHGPYAPDELVLERKRDGSVRGVIYYGAQLVVAADEPAALDAFAIETRKYPGLRSFVGPKNGPWARRERIFPRTALGRRGRISHLEMLAGWQQTKWSGRVGPEIERGENFKTARFTACQ